MRFRSAVAFVVVTLASAGPACDDGGGDTLDDPGLPAEPTEVMVPRAYAGMINPFEGDASAAIEGGQLYRAHCQGCHGDNARGSGPESGGLTPAPADLIVTADRHADDYMYWRIAEGGMAPFNSQMPAYSRQLSEGAVWKIVSFLRLTATRTN